MNPTPFRVAFALYGAGAMALGAYIGLRERRARKDTPEVFWAAERRLPGWAAGLSLSAGMLSISWSCVYGVQLIYRFGISGIWLLSVPWLIVLSIYLALGPKIRQIPAFSQPEMAARRFGPAIRYVVAPALAFVFVAWCGAEMYAAGKVLGPFLAAPPELVMIAIGLVVATYTTLGGFPSVITTDVLQYSFVALFLSVISVAAVRRAAGGGSFLAAVARAASPPGSPAGPFDLFAAGLPFILISFAAYLPGWLAETDIWIRISATRNARETRTAVGVTIANSVFFVLLAPVLLGLAALALYPAVAGRIPEPLAGGEAILSVFIRDLFSSGVALLMVVGLLAAGMSTIDTTANVVALSLGYDLVLPLRRAKRPEETRGAMRVSRTVNALSVVLALAFALNSRSLLDIFYLSSAVLSAAVFPVILALFLPRAKKAAAYLGASCGLAGVFGFYAWQRWGNLSEFEPTALAATGVSYIIWALVVAAAGALLGQFFGRAPD